MTVRMLVSIIVGGVLLLGAAGCSSALGPVTPSSSSGASPTLRENVAVRLWDNPQGFDPATLFRTETENVAFNIYSGLTTYEAASGAIIPDLAEKWGSSDAKTWTFSLRKGVQWQKGYGELTSADVLYSYKRILDPATASPYKGEFANIVEVTAPDAYTVKITLKEPDAGFLHQVASYHQGQIVKKEAVEKYGDQYQMNPVGTGPFALDRFTPNSEIVLTRHDGYFKGPAKLKKVSYSIIKDDATAEVALKNAEVDLGRILQDPVLERLQKDGRFTFPRVDYGVSLMVLNTEYEPLSKLPVRQAIAHGVDWKAIIKSTAPITATESVNFLPNWMSVYTDKVPTYPYNPDKAKALLKEAGYPDGFAVKSLGTSASGVSDADLLVQSYLGKLGIKLDFELAETAVFNKRRNSGDFQLSGRLLPAVNPDTILFSYLHPSNLAPKGLNGARYNNPEVTRLLEQARAEQNTEKRNALYAEIQRQALTDLYYIPRSQTSGIWPTWNYVKGVVPNKLNNVDFWPVTVEGK